ncbi:CBS domain-containing protein [Seinonella peptonophila]|uniref:CBS domain-containing protein n=1 Tax=Seinonella peptonophila TaxID=112248 RepID=A0A1M4VM48_9BACL|nr:CBS domain-containing protein [Seinonella peptonophila]SHE69870.1 CBS domain-containing protein [Seinonella peptonophila]
MKVKDVMTVDVKTVQSTDNLFLAACIMRDENVGLIPVVDEGRLVGVITDRDLAVRGIAEKRPNSTEVKALMSTVLVSATPEMNLEEAAHMMGNAQIRRLPVVEKEQLVGILAIADLATDGEQGQMSEAMSEISEAYHDDRSNRIPNAPLH